MYRTWVKKIVSKQVSIYMQTVFKAEPTSDQHLAATSLIPDTLYNPTKNLSSMLFTGKPFLPIIYKLFKNWL